MSANECPNCLLWFASEASFDRHRVLDSRAPCEDPPCFRCLTKDEMRRGLPVSDRWTHGRKTMWRQNRHGHWTHRAPVAQKPRKGVQVEARNRARRSGVGRAAEPGETLPARSA